MLPRSKAAFAARIAYHIICVKVNLAYVTLEDALQMRTRTAIPGFEQIERTALFEAHVQFEGGCRNTAGLRSSRLTAPAPSASV